MDVNTSAWVVDDTPIRATRHESGTVSVTVGQAGHGTVTLFFNGHSADARANMRRLRDLITETLGE